MFLRQYATTYFAEDQTQRTSHPRLVWDHCPTAESSRCFRKRYRTVRKLTKILSSLTQPFFSLSVQPTPDHTKLFIPVCLLMKLEESKGLSGASAALYRDETLISSDAFLIPSVSAFDALWVRHPDRQLCALPI